MNYIPENWKIQESAGRPPLFRSATGYGSKIPTGWVCFSGSRKRRVYAICYSNCASHYVLVKGEKVFVPDSMFP